MSVTTSMHAGTKKNVIYTSLDGADNFPQDAYEEYCEMNDLDYDEDDEISYNEWVADQVDIWAGDERENLDIDLDCDLIAVGGLGSWTGRINYFAPLKTRNIGKALFEVPARFRSIVEVDMYGKDGEITVDCIHHDGTNHINIRKCDKGFTATEIHDMLDDGKITVAEVYAKTSSLYNDVAEVYGWDLM